MYIYMFGYFSFTHLPHSTIKISCIRNILYPFPKKASEGFQELYGGSFVIRQISHSWKEKTFTYFYFKDQISLVVRHLWQMQSGFTLVYELNCDIRSVEVGSEVENHSLWTN